MGLPAPTLDAPRSPRYLSLDLWRGVACLLVVLHHGTNYSRFVEHFRIPDEDRGNPFSWLVAGTSVLWIGVPIFFVISGYCISATADATRRRGHPLWTYFLRRFRRIYPPYWAAVLVLLFLTGVIDHYLIPELWCDKTFGCPRPDTLNRWQWLGNLTLTESWRWHVHGGPPQLFHVLSWTLCYEEQFYFVVGVLLALAGRRFFLAAVITTVGAMCAVFFSPSWEQIKGFWFDGHWLAFAAGILVYYRVNYAGRRGVWAANGVLLAGALLYGYFFPLHSAHSSLGELNFVALTFALVLSLLHPWDARIATAWPLRPVVFCGTICYSLYLIHWPVMKAVSHTVHLLGLQGDTAIVLVTLPVGVVASVAVSWLFYRLVEKRFLNPPQIVARATGKTAAPAKHC